MLRDNLTSAFAVGLASRLFVQLFALVQIMLASRFLGLAEFGSYALAWACAAIFTAFIFTGYFQAFLRSQKPDEDRNTIFGAMFAVGITALFLLLLAGALIGDHQPLTSHFFIAIAALPLIDSVSAWNEVHLMRKGRIRTISVNSAVSEAAATIVLTIGLLGGLGPMSLVMARYTASVVNVSFSAIFVRRFPVPSFDLSVLRRGKRTALPLWMSTGAAMLTNYGVDLILGVFLNPSQVGAYRGGARISQTAGDLVQQPLMILTWSHFSRILGDNRQSLIASAWRTNMSLGTAVAWPLMLCVALLSEELVSVILDVSWLPAAVIVSILSIVRAIRILTSLLEPTLTSFDRQYLQLKIRVFGLAMTFLAILLFGRHSAEQAAMVQVYTATVVAIISLVVMRRILNINIRDLFYTFLPAILLSGACGLFVLITEPIRTSTEPTTGLIITLLGLLLLWGGAASVALSKQILRWPSP